MKYMLNMEYVRFGRKAAYVASGGIKLRPAGCHYFSNNALLY